MEGLSGKGRPLPAVIQDLFTLYQRGYSVFSFFRNSLCVPLLLCRLLSEIRDKPIPCGVVYKLRVFAVSDGRVIRAGTQFVEGKTQPHMLFAASVLKQVCPGILFLICE